MSAAVRSFSPLLLLLAAAPLLAQVPPGGQPPALPSLAVTVTPRQATVGDRIAVELTLRVPAGTLAGDPRFPVWGAAWGDAEILEKEEARKAGEEAGAAVWRQRLALAAFRTGQIDLPPAAVAVPLRDRTVQATTPASLGFTVRSVLPPGEKDPKAKPPAALRPLPLGARFAWTLAALAALCALAGWALWRREHGRVEAAAGARPILHPLAELTGELDRLAAETSMLVLHTRLSLALRHYLGRALRVPAPESTTTEVQRLLLGRRIEGPLVRQTVELLRACDLVKFARQEVGESRGRERVETARQLGGRLEAHARSATGTAETSEPREPLEAAG